MVSLYRPEGPDGIRKEIPELLRETRGPNKTDERKSSVDNIPSPAPLPPEGEGNPFKGLKRK
jgi:hypothetical protein